MPLLRRLKNARKKGSDEPALLAEDDDDWDLELERSWDGRGINPAALAWLAKRGAFKNSPADLATGRAVHTGAPGRQCADEAVAAVNGTHLASRSPVIELLRKIVEADDALHV
jgi:hypothetical protein